MLAKNRCAAFSTREGSLILGLKCVRIKACAPASAAMPADSSASIWALALANGKSSGSSYMLSQINRSTSRANSPSARVGRVSVMKANEIPRRGGPSTLWGVTVCPLYSMLFPCCRRDQNWTGNPNACARSGRKAGLRSNSMRYARQGMPCAAAAQEACNSPGSSNCSPLFNS